MGKVVNNYAPYLGTMPLHHTHIHNNTTMKNHYIYLDFHGQPACDTYECFLEEWASYPTIPVLWIGMAENVAHAIMQYQATRAYRASPVCLVK